MTQCWRCLPLALVVLALCLSGATAATPQADEKTIVHQEVLTLLDRLAASSCQFNRNGTWYGAERAAAHLKRKFDYITARSLLTSAEQFIELSATKSSFSGRAYQVRCGAGQPEASQSWLLDQLAQLRQAPAKTAVSN